MPVPTAWLVTTLERIFPRTPARSRRLLAIDSARGERHSFQVAVHNPAMQPAQAALKLQCDLPTRVRTVGYVPMPHLNTDNDPDDIDGAKYLPGYAPDPLFDEHTLTIGPLETHAFWCNITVPVDADRGSYRCVVTVSVGEAAIAELVVTVRAHQLQLRPRQNFPVVQWFYADALCDHYNVQPFDEGFWAIVEPYMRNLSEHFQDCIYAPIFTPPLDGVKRPTQLLKVTRTATDQYRFDWSDVKRWVDTARASGITYFEWTHFFTQWGVKNAIRIYEQSGGMNPTDEHLLWPADTAATAPVYRAFLEQFMPEFHKFLERERLLERSFFHVSDEPHKEHVDNYRSARQLLKDTAPWMKVMDALSDITFGRMHLTDLPIPIIDKVPEFISEGLAYGCYYCCAPRGRYINRHFDTPLMKIRMNGWLFYRLEADLFLHWGYNYWYKSQTRQLIDTYRISDATFWPTWCYGDTFCVYPGPRGPVDSLRWEVFAESLQDYALLQSAGIDPSDPLLAECRDFAQFPRNPGWLQHVRSTVLRGKKEAVGKAG
jgi:hypothetical protein